MQALRGSKKVRIVLIYEDDMPILLIVTSTRVFLIWEITQSSFALSSWDLEREKKGLKNAGLWSAMKSFGMIPEEEYVVYLRRKEKREKEVETGGERITMGHVELTMKKGLWRMLIIR